MSLQASQKFISPNKQTLNPELRGQSTQGFSGNYTHSTYLKNKPMLQSKFRSNMSVSTTSSAFFNSLPLSNSVTHKDYVKNLILNKLYKKYGQQSSNDFFTQQIINNEVLKFIKNEKMNKDTYKDLEARIQNQLDSRIQNKQSLNQRLNSVDKVRINSQSQVFNKGMNGGTNKNSQGLLPELRQKSYKDLLQLKLNQEQQEEDRLKSAAVMDLETVSSHKEDNKRMSAQFEVGRLQPINILQQIREKERAVKDQLDHEDEWAEVDEYRQLIYDREQLRLKQLKLQEMSNFKTQLDKQVREKNLRKQQIVQQKQQNANQVKEQVKQFLSDQEIEKQRLQNKMNLQKVQREIQMKEVEARRKSEQKAKKVYEQELVDDLKKKIQADKDREYQKRLDQVKIAEEMKKENEQNKIIRTDLKQKQKEHDAKLAQDYINLINEQERQKRLEVERREKRVADFMNKMEKSVIAEENKKAKFMEDNIAAYQQKRDKEDYLEQERRKKKVLERQEQMRYDLRNQIEEKNAKKKFLKEMNNEYVHIFKEKVEKDMEKERKEIQALKDKSRQVQEAVIHQIEEKKKRQHGMTYEEFDFNKDLLKEIIDKKKEIKQDIEIEKTTQMQLESSRPKPTYEVYDI